MRFTIRIPLSCQQGVTFVHCPGCLRHGSDHLSFSMRRTNYGEPDNNNDGIADSVGQLDFNNVDTATVMVGDTLLGVLSSIVSRLNYPNDPVPNGFEYGYYEITIPPPCENSLTPLGAKVVIHDFDITDSNSGSDCTIQLDDTTYFFDIPQSKIETLTTGKYLFDLSIDTIQSDYGVDTSFKRYHWCDEITVMPMFKVTGNIGTQTQLCSPVTNHIYMGIGPTPQYDAAGCCDCMPVPIIDTATNDTIPIIDHVTGDTCMAGVILTSGDTVCQCDSTVRYFCEFHGGSFRLMGYTPYMNMGFTTDNCAQGVHISNSIQVGLESGINNFPYEYRNWGFTDTVSVNVPPGFDVDSVSLYQTRTAGWSYIIQYIHDVDPDNVLTDINGDTVLTFNIDSLYTHDSALAFNGSDSLYFSDDDYGFGLIAWFHPTCNTRDTTAYVPGYISYQPLFNYEADADTVWSFGQIFTYISPSFSIQPTLVTVDGVTRTACWKMHITNASNGRAFHTWMAAGSPSGNIDVISITPGNPQNDIFTLEDLGPYEARDVQVCANYDCKNPLGKDTLIVYLGWNCPYYPASIQYYPCELDSFIFILQPRTSALQREIVINNNNDSISICQFIPVEVIISSSDVANVYNITVQQTIPEGMVFDSLIGGQLEYPVGIVVDSNLTPVFNGNSITWYLENYNPFFQEYGLPGSGFTKHADSTEMKISYNLISTCSLNPQHQTSITVSGITNCRDSIILPTFIKTFEIIDYPQYAQKTVEIAAEDFSVCDSTATIEVIIVNVDSIATDSIDLFNFVLPDCVSYNDAFTGITNPPAGIPDTNGNTVTWNLPDGVEPGDTIAFSFDVKITDSSCGNITYNYEGSTTVADSLPCGLLNNYCYYDVPAGEDFTDNKLRVPLSSVISPYHVSCNGVCDGSATISVSGGSTPYSYLWSNGEINSAISGLCAALYKVTVTDHDSCSITDGIIITEPPILNSDIISSVDATCWTPCNGSATVSATGGTPPYTYLWTNNTTQPTVNTLCGILNTVTVTDSHGCKDTSTVTITAPPELFVNIGLVTNVSCHGFCDGELIGSFTGGVAPHSFLWSDPLAQTDSLAHSLCAGSYTLTVTDALGCSQHSSNTITQPTVLHTTLLTDTFPSGHNISCYGDSVGIINQTVSGGTPPCTFIWNDGAVSEDRDSIPAGAYTVTVTDANGCINVDSITLTEPDLLTSSLTGSIFGGYNVSCNGDTNGSIDLTVTGGASPYSYLWSDGESTDALQGVSAGIYSVTVTDINECTSTSSITLTEPGVLTSVISDSTEISCIGACDGTATVSVTGGASPYFYAWSNGDNTLFADSLCTGIYNVSIMDTNGCQTMSSVFIPEPDAFVHEKPDVEELVVCTESPFEILFSNHSCDTLFDVRVTAMMPDGMIYTPGSVTSNLASIAAEDISIPNWPQFNIPVIPTGSDISINYNAFTGCEIIPHFSSGNLILDSTLIEYSTDNYNHIQILKNTESHNVLYANLAITGITNNTYTGIAGAQFQRTLTIVNGGNMASAGFLLLDMHGDGIEIMTIDTGMLLNGSGADTVMFDSIFLPPGGSMQLTETVKIVGCNSLNSKFIVAGCNTGSCEDDINYASVAVFPGWPKITGTIAIPDSFNYCGNDGKIKYIITNNGWQAGTDAGAARSFSIRFETPQNVAVLDSFIANGEEIPDSIIEFNASDESYTIHFSGLDYDLDGAGGITDINGDSIFAELPVGDTLIIEMDIHLNFDEDFSPLLARYVNSYIKTWVGYYDQCGDGLMDIIGKYFDLDRKPCLDQEYLVAPLDINNNDTVPVSLCMNLPVGDQIVIDCPSNRYFAYLNLPQNYVITSPVTWNDDTISSNIWQGDTIILDGGGRQGCYNFDITLNCDTANPFEVTDTIRYALMYACDTGECLKEVTSNSFTMTNHYYDCPDTNPSCIATTDINVQRTTLGWTDATKTTPVTDTTEGIRLDAAYVFDRIRVEVKGIVKFSAFNNVHIELAYTLPDSVNILTFADAKLNFIRNGDTLSNNCPLNTFLLSIVDYNPVTFVLDFEVNMNTCLPPPYLTFPDDSIILIANFVVEEPAYLNSLNNIFSVFTARHYGINSLGDTLGCASQRQ
ncbi:MAG: SprB repeat-containing protein, partial [Bacteroidia bacterium]|nr:SprB repeat-containing protein [Bacteroidia bacterium]